MNKLETKKLELRKPRLTCFDGDKIPGGVIVTKEHFMASQTARIEINGVDEDGKEYALLFTPKKDGKAVFSALSNDIFTNSGKMTCKGTVVESEEINGEVKEYNPPRFAVELTDDKGNKAFTFTANPTPKWCEKYGTDETTPIDRGRDEAAQQALADKRKEFRKASRGGV